MKMKDSDHEVSAEKVEIEVTPAMVDAGYEVLIDSGLVELAHISETDKIVAKHIIEAALTARLSSFENP